MLPDNELSSIPLPSDIIGSRSIVTSALEDYEDGGIALNDASEGLQYQMWHGFLDGDDICVEAPNTAKTVVYTGADITEISFTFDQLMRINIAFVQEGVAKLYWYDSTIADYTVTSFERGARLPRVFLDDKRDSQTEVSDILLVYIADYSLFYRLQRDRYEIEYELAIISEANLITSLRVGMGKNLRIQFILS